ncbi:MAG: hypothetical protein CVU52_02800 [Deltaproteobacteria bacterium HGW-Deltaproteobacteria-10]|nr:MAG: hypothetical protein CVU52_02800 [Deltaproteobacteria bacterium HGW-Deltaproteobacteria-10]
MFVKQNICPQNEYIAFSVVLYVLYPHFSKMIKLVMYRFAIKNEADDKEKTKNRIYLISLDYYNKTQPPADSGNHE